MSQSNSLSSVLNMIPTVVIKFNILTYLTNGERICLDIARKVIRDIPEEVIAEAWQSAKEDEYFDNCWYEKYFVEANKYKEYENKYREEYYVSNYM